LITVGVKLTHDGTVAVLDDSRLVASVEMEKRDNNLRFSRLDDLDTVACVLAEHGVTAADVDTFAVDGWGWSVPTNRGGEALDMRVAPYRETDLGDDSLAAFEFDGLPLARTTKRYVSFFHTTGHILSTYCTSPYAQAADPSYVLVWDGGVQPRLYHVTPVPAGPPRVTNLGPIFGLFGSAYATFVSYFPPFRREDQDDPEDWQTYHQLQLPGKIMAYAALGTVRDDLTAVLDQLYASGETVSPAFADDLARAFIAATTGLAYEPADAIATFQYWLGQRLLAALAGARRRHRGTTTNLCLSGGCALNIKWNSAIRRSGDFSSCFVPPFPNDSGAAIGAACGVLVRSGQIALDWNAYSGPALGTATGTDGYTTRPCSPTQLAALLHEVGEPVIVLHGRAELGPRALGNRSILAPATNAATRDVLNDIKDREAYRPVSPICLEADAPHIFDPGTPDPYMLFEHTVRDDWAARIPAVVHVDGSSRLQTVNQEQNPTIASVLADYARLSGVPVLCNTSANASGRGFFPDVASALRWGRTRYVWSDGTLWERDA
jgi:carbamoyltransferase